MQIKSCLYALVPLMSPITHLLFVVVWYCKQIWFRQQSGTSEWDGSDYWGRWNLHPFSSPSALCLCRSRQWKTFQNGFQIGTDTCLPSWLDVFFFRLHFHEFQAGLWCSWDWEIKSLRVAVFPAAELTSLVFLPCLNEVVLCFVPTSHTHFLLGCQK